MSYLPWFGMRSSYSISYSMSIHSVHLCYWLLRIHTSYDVLPPMVWDAAFLFHLLSDVYLSCHSLLLTIEDTYFLRCLTSHGLGCGVPIPSLIRCLFILSFSVIDYWGYILPTMSYLPWFGMRSSYSISYSMSIHSVHLCYWLLRIHTSYDVLPPMVWDAEFLFHLLFNVYSLRPSLLLTIEDTYFLRCLTSHGLGCGVPIPSLIRCLFTPSISVIDYWGYILPTMSYLPRFGMRSSYSISYPMSVHSVHLCYWLLRIHTSYDVLPPKVWDAEFLFHLLSYVCSLRPSLLLTIEDTYFLRCLTSQGLGCGVPIPSLIRCLFIPSFSVINYWGYILPTMSYLPRFGMRSSYSISYPISIYPVILHYWLLRIHTSYDVLPPKVWDAAFLFHLLFNVYLSCHSLLLTIEDTYFLRCLTSQGLGCGVPIPSLIQCLFTPSISVIDYWGYILPTMSYLPWFGMRSSYSISYSMSIHSVHLCYWLLRIHTSYDVLPPKVWDAAFLFHLLSDVCLSRHSLLLTIEDTYFLWCLTSQGLGCGVPIPSLIQCLFILSFSVINYWGYILPTMSYLPWFGMRSSYSISYPMSIYPVILCYWLLRIHTSYDVLPPKVWDAAFQFHLLSDVCSLRPSLLLTIEDTYFLRCLTSHGLGCGVPIPSLIRCLFTPSISVINYWRYILPMMSYLPWFGMRRSNSISYPMSVHSVHLCCSQIIKVPVDKAVLYYFYHNNHI